MQKDAEVGRIAKAVPVIICILFKNCVCFIVLVSSVLIFTEVAAQHSGDVPALI